MAGSIRITAAGVVGVSGKAVRIFGFTTRSGGGGPGTVTLYNGTSTGGTEKYIFQGNTDSSADKAFGVEGKFFPAGCYADLDANISYVDFDYLQEQTS
jgi:hypothetical protein